MNRVGKRRTSSYAARDMLSRRGQRMLEHSHATCTVGPSPAWALHCSSLRARLSAWTWMPSRSPNASSILVRLCLSLALTSAPADSDAPDRGSSDCRPGQPPRTDLLREPDARDDARP